MKLGLNKFFAKTLLHIYNLSRMEGISNKTITIFFAEKTSDDVKKNCWCFFF